MGPTAPSIWTSLEVVKLIVSVMTPLAVFFLGWFLSLHLRRIENREKEQRRATEEQQQQQLRILEEQRRILEEQRLQVENELRLLQEQQLRLANRNEFQRLTLEINKELLRDPSLDAFDHPADSGRTPEHVKLEALAYIYMNMFELIYQYYHPSDNLTKREEEEWRVWDEVLRSTLADSLALRAVVAKEDCRRIYYAGFFDYIKEVLQSSPTTVAAPDG